MTKSLIARSLFLGAAAVVLTASAASAAGPFQFYSVTPCRIVDTRGNGFSELVGPPALTGGQPRSFPITGRCGTRSAIASNRADARW